MDRRTFLTRSLALVAAGGIAGCVTDGDTGTSETTTPTDSGPALESSSLEMTSGGCGQQRDEAAVRFDSDAGTAVVTGTIWGDDACHVPELAEASYDGTADVLTVTVTTNRPDEDRDRACADCVTELGYEVTAEFTGGLPGEVRVDHDHGDGPETVATASSE